MDKVQQLLLLSQKLFETLENMPEDIEEKREAKITLVDKLLDARGQTITLLQQESKNPLKGHTDEQLLKKLNEGIVQRLQNWKSEIASDMTQLQMTKKSERSYMNPYSALQNFDGTYFDGKK